MRNLPGWHSDEPGPCQSRTDQRFEVIGAKPGWDAQRSSPCAVLKARFRHAWYIAEGQAIAASLDLAIPKKTMARRLNAAGSVVGHKMSMLQDLERGRSLEIDALVTAVRELGRLVEVATPTIDAVLALVQERGRQAGLYGNDAQR